MRVSDSLSRELFLNEVLEGLRQPTKRLPCKYFYDAEGSRLFERICELEEYYPTRTELEIMKRHAGEMAELIGRECMLIEYGSGSSVKTPILLDALEEPAVYVPIDISCEHLSDCARRLADRYPDVEILPLCADYTASYELPATDRRYSKRVVYFPGSTIGNFARAEAVDFLAHVAEVCGEHGGLLVGVDLEKDPRVLELAYNDASGVTAAFNLNLLRRINRELDADLRVDQFRHRAFYNHRLGRIEMHVESLREQSVRVGDEEFRFQEGESIHTENSYKYTVESFRALAQEAGFEVKKVWTDPDRLFSVQYLEVS